MTVFPFRPLALILAALAIPVFGAGMSRAAEDDQTTTNAVGVWDLKLDGGTKQCRMMLRRDPLRAGYAFGMPGGCHLAFPFLAKASMWNEVGGTIRFEDGKGEILLSLDPRADGVMTGNGPGGELLRFEAVGKHVPTVLAATASPPPLVDSGTKSAKSTTVKALRRSPVPPMAELAGHYSVLRSLGKDTGCMVTLDEKARGPNGSLKANLAPACRDQGIVIFDPVGWQIQAGQLVLTARKGHTAKFDLDEDGVWTKDAKEGAHLSLKKM